jgi:hypothetical protein
MSSGLKVEIITPGIVDIKFITKDIIKARIHVDLRNRFKTQASIAIIANAVNHHVTDLNKRTFADLGTPTIVTGLACSDEKQIKNMTELKNTTLRILFKGMVINMLNRFLQYDFTLCDRCIIEEMTDIKQKLGQTLFPAPLHDA